MDQEKSFEAQTIMNEVPGGSNGMGWKRRVGYEVQIPLVIILSLPKTQSADDERDKATHRAVMYKINPRWRVFAGEKLNFSDGRLLRQFQENSSNVASFRQLPECKD